MNDTEPDYHRAGREAHMANPSADSEFDTIFGAYKYWSDTHGVHGDSLAFMLFSVGWDSIFEEETNA